MESQKRPWREAGLTERQAAAHLLDRFSFGSRPGDVDRVVAMGVERWFNEQLAGRLDERRLEERLATLPTLELSLSEMVARYPDPVLVLRQAERAGQVSLTETTSGDSNRRELRRQVLPWAREQGYHPQYELLADLLAQKLYRGVYAENQLAEVLVDFWSNHLYVSLTDRSTRVYVLGYERDAIRPRVLGGFRDLLAATARHPAMLLYLDNARSSAQEGQPTTLERRLARGRDVAAGRGGLGGGGGLRGGSGGGQRRGGLGGGFGSGERQQMARRFGQQSNRPRGLNENYARELLELHTLGVDGGYSQADVVEVARAFTGWSILPPGEARQQIERRLALLGGGRVAGFLVEGEFFFRPDLHDAAAKTVLGKKLSAGRGIEDGEDVLDLLAIHPSTARHLAGKLAVRFVADEPSPVLVDRLARVFLEKKGNLAALMLALFYSPEFWLARGEKIKSPYELAVSALRATGGEVYDPAALLEWIARMGQPLYLYQAPTGFPERAAHWVSTGALLNRMSFGLELATGRVPGVAVANSPSPDEPESRREALAAALARLLPERDTAATFELLLPIVEAPSFTAKLSSEAAREVGGEGALAQLFNEESSALAEAMGAEAKSSLGRLFAGRRTAALPKAKEPTAAEQIVGVILGSPEFQRR